MMGQIGNCIGSDGGVLISALSSGQMQQWADVAPGVSLYHLALLERCSHDQEQPFLLE